MTTTFEEVCNLLRDLHVSRWRGAPKGSFDAGPMAGFEDSKGCMVLLYQEDSETLWMTERRQWREIFVTRTSDSGILADRILRELERQGRRHERPPTHWIDYVRADDDTVS